ncbi:hypothetical protein AAVH_25228 [Aphelenchoides avenae]|nr:hypothetical protein AAVH_25228 [Aphelenchus avenae]
MNKSGNKRKAAASEAASPAKRPTNVLVLQLDSALGVKQTGASVLIQINDVIIDVFQFLRRRELDTLQVVSRRFDAIVQNNMSLVCLRQLKSAEMLRSGAKFVLVMEKVGAKRKTRLRTGVIDEAAATMALLNACQSSRIERLELYGTTPLSGRFFDSLALCAPSIFLNHFCIGSRTLADGVADDKVLRALQTFAGLERVTSEAWKDLKLQYCLMRCCFKASASLEVRLHESLFDEYKCDPTAVENALLELCFGTCDEQYAKRERRLEISFPAPLESDDFLQRLIENAEVHTCRNKLTLDITTWDNCNSQSASVCMLQDTTDLDAYKKGGQFHGYMEEERFASVSGRHWTVTYSVYTSNTEYITFEINH